MSRHHVVAAAAALVLAVLLSSCSTAAVDAFAFIDRCTRFSANQTLCARLSSCGWCENAPLASRCYSTKHSMCCDNSAVCDATTDTCCGGGRFGPDGIGAVCCKKNTTSCCPGFAPQCCAAGSVCCVGGAPGAAQCCAGHCPAGICCKTTVTCGGMTCCKDQCYNDQCMMPPVAGRGRAPRN